MINEHHLILHSIATASLRLHWESMLNSSYLGLELGQLQTSDRTEPFRALDVYIFHTVSRNQ